MLLDTPRDPIVAHAGRVLILIDAFSTPAATSMDSLGKLARLDFMLRHPVVLEQVICEQNVPAYLRPTTSERLALESAMIIWKYGPWDHRYHGLIGRLLSQQLIHPMRLQRPVALRCTEVGTRAAAALPGPDWDRVRGRAKLLHKRANHSSAKLAERINPVLERLDA